MAHNSPPDSRDPSTPPQSIPLQDLARPPDISQTDGEQRGHNRGRSILSAYTGPTGSITHGTRYERLDDASPTPIDRNSLHQKPALIQSQPVSNADNDALDSALDNPAAFRPATGFAGLTLEETNSAHTPPARPGSSYSAEHLDPLTPYGQADQDSHDSYFHTTESDQTPLTDPNYLRPGLGVQASTPRSSQERTSFQSIRFNTPESRTRSSRLGDELSNAEAQYGRPRGSSFGQSLSPHSGGRSRSSSTAGSPLTRAGSIMRAMSQRVVNLSNEAESPDHIFRRTSSVARDRETSPSVDFMAEDTAYHPDRKSMQVEKEDSIISRRPSRNEIWPESNPFRGKSLGIFSPSNPIRIQLCNFLVHPLTEPFILALIIGQTVLLAVESAPNVYLHPRSSRWGGNKLDFALLAFYIIFTFEIAARIIVSGFFFNAPEYRTIDSDKGLWAAAVNKYDKIFRPQRRLSTKKPMAHDPDVDANPFSTTILRSFTSGLSGQQAPTSIAELQRQRLARRAFLRHSLNRIDFVAIVSFWICFALGVIGIEATRHLYVFRMMGCLRILRLLALTNGTSVCITTPYASF